MRRLITFDACGTLIDSQIAAATVAVLGNRQVAVPANPCPVWRAG